MARLREWFGALKYRRKPRISSLGLQQTKVVLLAGLSGVGKSTLCHTFRDSATLIELDGILVHGFHLLVKGNFGDDPFSYGLWQDFLADTKNVEHANRFISREITQRLSGNLGRLAVIVGNHFVLDSFRELVEQSLAGLGIKKVRRLFLDLPAEQIYEHRRSRANAYDLEITLQLIIAEREAFVRTLTASGFQRVSPAACFTAICRMNDTNQRT